MQFTLQKAEPQQYSYLKQMGNSVSYPNRNDGAQMQAYQYKKEYGIGCSTMITFHNKTDKEIKCCKTYSSSGKMRNCFPLSISPNDKVAAFHHSLESLPKSSCGIITFVIGIDELFISFAWQNIYYGQNSVKIFIEKTKPEDELLKKYDTRCEGNKSQVEYEVCDSYTASACIGHEETPFLQLEIQVIPDDIIIADQMKAVVATNDKMGCDGF